MKACQILALFGIAAVGMAQTLAPSPTESIGCIPHGDHWDCDGPRPALTAPVTTPTTPPTTGPATTTSDHDGDHMTGSSSLPPSPTASIGCQPHGDHWHCDGPRTAAGAGNDTSSTRSTPSSAGATGRVGFGAAAIGGVVGAALLAL